MSESSLFDRLKNGSTLLIHNWWNNTMLCKARSGVYTTRFGHDDQPPIARNIYEGWTHGRFQRASSTQTSTADPRLRFHTSSCPGCKTTWTRRSGKPWFGEHTFLDLQHQEVFGIEINVFKKGHVPVVTRWVWTHFLAANILVCSFSTDIELWWFGSYESDAFSDPRVFFEAKQQHVFLFSASF